MSRIDELLDTLERAGRREDAVKLMKVLHDTSISDTMIARLLSSSQFKVERKAVKRYRVRNGIKER